MTQAECRERVRALIESGELPPQAPRVSGDRGGPATSATASQLIGGSEGAICLICAERGPALLYVYPDGRRIPVHREPCDIVWRSESGRMRQQAAAAKPVIVPRAELPRSEFIQWLADRMEQDANFQSRMDAALTGLRVERALDARRAGRRP
jgi:hypothetical protein